MKPIARLPALLLVSVLLLAACGGGGGSKYTLQQTEDILRQAAIVKEDLPAVLPQAARQPITKAQIESASLLLDDRDARDLAKRSKAVWGYLADFQSFPNETQLAGGWIIWLHEELIYHETPEGASEVIADAVERQDDIAGRFMNQLAIDPTLRNLRRVDAPLIIVGDESFNLRVAADSVPEEEPHPLVHDLVFFRRDNVSVLFVLVATEDRAAAALRTLAKADERIIASLDAGPPVE